MLQLKNICKTYQIGKHKQTILDNINLEFKNQELVFILGASGSGKSTLLNIIGGNLKCDYGEIYFNNLHITKFKTKELTTYRRNIVSTIFQDYNLIEYLTVKDNILIGCHRKVTKEELNTLLKELNIYAKKDIVVNKLSGGEKQRVAIARALINNPKIILADEPTGALDSKNSHEVMALFKQIAKDRLVIVVTHNNSLANKYGNRTITIKDGKCKSNKVNDENLKISLNNKYHNLKNIFKLSIKSLTHKLFRNLATAMAISIGLISVILVTNIYSNFNKELNELERRIVTIYPITIKNGEYKLTNNQVHINKIDDTYLTYLKNIKEINYINCHYDILFPLITDSYHLLSKDYLEVYPNNNNYNILFGSTVSTNHDILLKIDQANNIDTAILEAFNLKDNTNYEALIGRKIHVISNNNYFLKRDDYYLVNDNYQELYEKELIELTIVGIVKEKESVHDGSAILYHEDIVNMLTLENAKSNIVQDLLTDKYKILGFTNDQNTLLSYLGYQVLPNRIDIYVTNLKDKEKVINKLTEYEKIIYEDTMSSSIEIVRKFIQIVSLILIIFSLLAVIVSSLMIAILTSMRVLEKRKEIGILKSLGYARRDIRLLFNLENMLIGVVSFIISLMIILLLMKPGNHLIDKYLGIDNLLNINYQHLVIVFIMNLFIIKIVGTIPANRASKLDTVACIYGK